MKEKRNLIIVFASIALVVLGVLIIAVLAITIPIVLFTGIAPQLNTPSNILELHTNPNDPIIISGQTLEGEVISILGNKSSTGIPQTVDEFRIEDDEGMTIVNMKDDGSIESVINSDGLQMEMTWGDNYTKVHVMLIGSNGTEQVSININLNQTTENVTDLEKTGIESNVERRSLENKNSLNSEKKTKRQTSDNNFADIRISVHSCNDIVNNALVYADVLTNYDESIGSSDESSSYIGVRTQVDGEYQILIPTSKKSIVGEEAKEICDSVGMVLSDVCKFYKYINTISNIFSKHDADTTICFILGSLPSFRLLPFHRFCKKAFKGLKFYCDKIDDETLTDGLCNGLTLVDNAIDIFVETKILFTPTVIFPSGNIVTAQGQVFTLKPGSQLINNNFIIEDVNSLKIKSLDINPFDPMPYQNYLVTAEFECFTSSFQVNMSIVGTDNYRNSISCNSGPICILYVPGAIEFVQDTITVIATDAGTRIKRIVTIIF